MQQSHGQGHCNPAVARLPSPAERQEIARGRKPMATTFTINTFSYIWTMTAKDCVAHLADQGYRSFELMMCGPHLFPSAATPALRKDIGAMMAARKLDVVSLNAGAADNNLTSPSPDMRRFSVDYLLQVMRLGADLGAQGIVIAPGLPRNLLPAPFEQMMSWMQQGLEPLLKEAEKSRLDLLFENIPSTFLPRVDQMMRAIERVGSDRLKIVYDVANGVYIKEDPCAAIRAAASRLSLVHLSDTTTQVWKHDPVGLGTVPFAAIGETLRAIGAKVPIVAEIISTNADHDIADSIKKLHAMGW
ncbi:MAG: sugar phosphate isomerase/epimerase [Alphaproteobacteria bacterium]|nr:sugar phosphate isomerase/epimerase [Alphaproteobacteria bacterium]